MKTPPPFIQIAKNLTDNFEWSLYMTDRGPMPLGHAESARIYAPALFYLGNLKHAKEVSYTGSIYWKNQAAKSKLETYKVLNLFKSALYRSLAHRNDEALGLWREVVGERQKILEEIVLKQRMAHLFVYEAYALAKLGHYYEVSKPAQKGFVGINKGRATYQAPHMNSHVYGLVNVLINLADYKTEPSEENKKQAQKSLLIFKKENHQYGRLGYAVIFDLQFSYPDVFEPILPSEDPDND